MVTSIELVPYILADLGPRGELLTKQTSFLVQPYARLARITLQNFTSLFLPAAISLASLHETHVGAQDKAIFKRYAFEPTQDKLNRDKMADMIAAGAHCVSNSQLQCTYTHKNILPIFRRILRMTPGTIKKPEFLRKPEDSHF